jgi:SpoIID/LytB domain protein
MSRALHAVVGAALATAVFVPAAQAPAATVSQTITIAPTQLHLNVAFRGNGHGHGLSQYGALGAAKAGLGYPGILRFYYPGTTLATAPTTRRVRVLIGDTGKALTVAADTNLLLTGVTGALRTSGIARYRLVADGTSTLSLQRLASAPGSTWHTIKQHLPNNAEFHRVGYSAMRLYFADGTSTRYYGVLRAVRAAPTGTTAGVQTINRVTYDKYAQGVVPREMPASWNRSATDAQAVAARTYADFAVRDPFNSSHPTYDICDTSMCQVYGGHIHYDVHGTVLYTDFPRAAADTSNKILEYKGGPVFAQFSASNGGWMVAGSQPYLVAKPDPYDIAKYDPYIGQPPTKITVASLAKAFGLPKLTKLVITRDGHGTWGGRVLTVSGYNGTTHVDKDGAFLQSALGLGTTWIQLTPVT